MVVEGEGECASEALGSQETMNIKDARPTIHKKTLMVLTGATYYPDQLYAVWNCYCPICLSTHSIKTSLESPSPEIPTCGIE